MIETDLGDWRRSVYSVELNSVNENTDVIVMGWVSSVRKHGNISFVMLQDQEGEIQIIVKTGECSDEIRERISKLKEHSSIAIKGKTKSSPKAPHGVEIIPSEMRVFSEAEKIAPFSPQQKTVPNIDTRLEIRAVDLRRNVLQKIFKVRSAVLQSIREYLYEQKYIEIYCTVFDGNGMFLLDYPILFVPSRSSINYLFY